MKTTRNLTRLCLLGALLSGIAAQAANITWTNTAGGNWSAAMNWSPHQLPTNTDNVLITTPGTYAVVVDAPVTISDLTLGAGGGGSGVQSLYVTNAGMYLVVTNSLLVTSGGAFTAGAA